MDPATLAAHLDKHLRVGTFPLGVISLQAGAPQPRRSKRPVKDLGVQVSICQAIGVARRYGWVLYFDGSDLSCPIAKAAFGFADRNDFYTSGTLADGMYASCREAGARFEEAVPKLERGEYAAISVGPLSRVDFVPDTVIVYGNSAQVVRLLSACLFDKGGAMRSEASGRADCADMIIRSLRTREPQFILPCHGDRIFGMTGDDEMAFTFPYAMADQVVRGLEGTHRGGVRYPIPVFLTFQAEYPETYQQLEKVWEEGEKK